MLHEIVPFIAWVVAKEIERLVRFRLERHGCHQVLNVLTKGDRTLTRRVRGRMRQRHTTIYGMYK